MTLGSYVPYAHVHITPAYKLMVLNSGEKGFGTNLFHMNVHHILNNNKLNNNTINNIKPMMMYTYVYMYQTKALYIQCFYLVPISLMIGAISTIAIALGIARC